MTPFLKQHDPSGCSIRAVGEHAAVVAHQAFPLGNLSAESFEKIHLAAVAPVIKTIRELGGADVDVEIATHLVGSTLFAGYLELCEQLAEKGGHA